MIRLRTVFLFFTGWAFFTSLTYAEKSYVPQQKSDWNQSDTSSVSWIRNKPVVKRIEAIQGITNASGIYTHTFTSPYLQSPNVMGAILNQTDVNQAVRVVSITTDGFVAHAYQHNSVELLGIDVLLSATVNVSDTIEVIVVER